MNVRRYSLDRGSHTYAACNTGVALCGSHVTTGRINPTPVLPLGVSRTPPETMDSTYVIFISDTPLANCYARISARTFPLVSLPGLRPWNSGWWDTLQIDTQGYFRT